VPNITFKILNRQCMYIIEISMYIIKIIIIIENKDCINHFFFPSCELLFLDCDVISL